MAPGFKSQSHRVSYRDKRKQLNYQNRWTQQRRLNWIQENGPCIDCGSWLNLEVDHKTSSSKVTHRVWTWALPRRLVELEKCVVRCHDCHVVKTTIFHEWDGIGHDRVQLAARDVLVIRFLAADGLRHKAIARIYGMDRSSVSAICRNERWKHVKGV